MEPTRIEDLLQHAGWLRTLARRLVADAHAADDLVQSTWVAALQSPPPGGGAGRRWLGVVLRNLARQARRGDVRRDERERIAARPEGVSVDLALQRTLLGAVESLAEPYRATLYRRYYEGLPPRRIAELEGVPVKTIKTRLHRGLALLRSRLDGEFGGEREAWLAALSPWLGSPSGPTLLGVSLVSAKLKTVLAAAAILAVLLVAWRWRTPGHAEKPGAEPAPEIVLAPSALPREPAAPERSASAPSSARESLAPPAPSSEALGAALVHGRVLDLHEQPVPGLGVWSFPRRHRGDAALELRPPEAWTDERGAFELPMPTGDAVVLVAAGPQHVTVLAADLWAAVPDARPLLVVAPRVRLAGVVRDPDGNAVPDARLWTTVDPELRLSLSAIVDTTLEYPGTTRRSDARGRFELTDAAGGTGLLHAWAPGFDELTAPVPADSRIDLELTLARPAAEVLVVRGRVVDERLLAVEGAWVSFEALTERSGIDGCFTLSIPARSARPAFSQGEGGLVARVAREIVAVFPGHLPAHFALPALDELRALIQRDERVTLTLGGPPLAIRGQVRDARGRPVADAEVWPLDPSETSHVPGGDDDGTLATSLEALMKGGMDAERVRTGPDGSFELGGLLARGYRLAGLHRPTVRSASTGEIAAGTGDVVLELEEAEACTPVHGRVLTLDGRPLPGVLVFPHGDESLGVFGERVVTDPEGRFAFPALSPDVTGFQVNGQELIWIEAPLGERDEELEIRLSRRFRVQVQPNGVEADQYAVLDGAGRRLELRLTKGLESWAGDTFPLKGERSPQASVPETARTLVLYLQGREVARQAFTPEPTRLTLVRF